MTSKSSKLIKVLTAVAMGATLAGCVSLGPTSNPIERKFQWLSYIEGEDFREACGPSQTSQYRMVYNGIYTEQLRTYDLSASGDLRVEVIGGEDLMELEVSQPSDLLNPWRGKIVNFQLDDVDVENIVTALDHDGIFGPPNAGLELSSKGFFWTIAACHEGQYHFMAVNWPSDTWEALTFDDALKQVDLTNIAFNTPRKTDLRRDREFGVNQATDIEFHTKVGQRGLARLSDLFQ